MYPTVDFTIDRSNSDVVWSLCGLVAIPVVFFFFFFFFFVFFVLCFVRCVVLLLCSVDPVTYGDRLVWEEGLSALLFFVYWLSCCFTLPLGITGRKFSVIVDTL